MGHEEVESKSSDEPFRQLSGQDQRFIDYRSASPTEPLSRKGLLGVALWGLCTLIVFALTCYAQVSEGPAWSGPLLLCTIAMCFIGIIHHMRSWPSLGTSDKVWRAILLCPHVAILSFIAFVYLSDAR
jgi:hypothetical protein